MARAKLKFRLHRAVIVLFCLALLVALMQGASWFSQSHQQQRNPQLEELARTLARQVTLNIAPLMRTETPDEKRIKAVLTQLTESSRILDAGVYDEQGDLITRTGESVDVRDRLALDGKKPGAILISKSLSPFREKRPAGLSAPDTRHPHACHRSEAGRQHHQHLTPDAASVTGYWCSPHTYIIARQAYPLAAIPFPADRQQTGAGRRQREKE